MSGTGAAAGGSGGGQPAALDSTSSVCWPILGAGPRTSPGVAVNLIAGATCSTGPSTGSSTVTTIRL